MERVVEDVRQRRVRDQRALAERGGRRPLVLRRGRQLRAVAEQRLRTRAARSPRSSVRRTWISMSGRVVVREEHERAVDRSRRARRRAASAAAVARRGGAAQQQPGSEPAASASGHAGAAPRPAPGAGRRGQRDRAPAPAAAPAASSRRGRGAEQQANASTAARHRPRRPSPARREARRPRGACELEEVHQHLGRFHVAAAHQGQRPQRQAERPARRPAASRRAASTL